MAEKLHTEHSDYDFIYEVGPGVVRNKLDSISPDSIENDFYYIKTEHEGFYQIEDQNGKFIYPILVQRALYHQLKINEREQREDAARINRIGNERAHLGESSTGNLSVDTKGTPKPSISTAKKDKVIAMRLDKWPTEIEEKFIERNPNLKSYTGRVLFFDLAFYKHA